MPINRIYSSTYHQLDIRHRMVQTGTNNTNQLMTGIYRRRSRPLLITPVPLLHTAFHLCRVVGSQGQTLKTMASSHRPRGNEVVQRQPVKSPLRTPRTLGSLEDIFGCWISPTRIIASNPRVLDIVGGFEPLEALRPSVVDVLGEGDESRRRRSVGSRHFNVEDRLTVQGATANAVVVSL